MFYNKTKTLFVLQLSFYNVELLKIFFLILKKRNLTNFLNNLNISFFIL